MLRTKYRKYFELQFLFSVNCIDGFFPLVLWVVFCRIFWGGFLYPLKSRLFSITRGRTAAFWNLDLLPLHFSPGSIAKDDNFKQRVEGRGWGRVTDAPGDPSLYKQVVYEEVSQKSAVALRGGRGSEGANSAKGPREDRSLLQIPHLLGSTFTFYRFTGVPAHTLASS